MKKYTNQSGQSLLEVIIALGIAVAIIISFTSATINAVRNAQFAKNQNQATKLAQETIEIIRTIRDQDKLVTATAPWSSLWTTNMNSLQISGYRGTCYLLNKTNFTMSPILGADSCNNSNDEIVEDIFKRKINITDDGTILTKKTISVKISWFDNKGTHSADVTTILTKWQ